MKTLQQSPLTFWLLQCLGWSPVFLLMLLLFGDDELVSSMAMTFALSIVIIAVLVSMLLRLAYRFLLRTFSSAIYWTLGIFVLSLFAAISVVFIHYYGWGLINAVVEGFSPVLDSQPASTIAVVLVPVYLSWSCLYWLITRQVALTKMNQDNELLTLKLKEGQLALLLSQLNPHFMFNTINNIRSLIRLDGDKARDMLTAFADILRYQFATESTATVTVEKELAFIDEYMAINQLQLGKRLTFVKRIEEKYTGYTIPKMAIQLLVENAIKHAYGTQGVTGELTLSVTADSERADYWCISLSHPGKVIESDNPGIGLDNLKERMLMYFSEMNFSLTDDEKGVTACLQIKSRE